MKKKLMVCYCSVSFIGCGKKLEHLKKKYKIYENKPKLLLLWQSYLPFAFAFSPKKSYQNMRINIGNKLESL